MTLEDRTSTNQLEDQLRSAQERIVELERDDESHHAAETALRLSEERFRKIFESSNDAIFIVDLDRARIIDANRRACQMLGYTREELLSIGVAEIHPNEFNQLMAFADQVKQQGQGWTDELTCRTSSGEFLTTEISASMIDIEGSPHLISLVRNISDRKKAEAALWASEEKFRQLMESAPDAVVGVNADGSILMLNKQVERLFGFAREELIGQPIERLIPERFHQIHAAHRGDYHAQPSTRSMGVGLDLFGRRSDGTEFPIDVSLSLVPTGESGESSEDGSLVVSIIRDATDRKRFEDTLQEVAVLEERNRLAREIHDTLAQGLTGLIWQINAARRTVSDGGDPALEHLDRIRDLARESLQEARRSVWDLRSGPLEGQTLVQALTQEAQRASSEAGPLRVSFGVSGIERVLPAGMEAALLRICQESLANALKYSQATAASVTLAFEDAQIALSVQDNGVGFDPETDGGQRPDSGGFGLVNMRERARLLGGDLAVYSGPGEGTLIQATLGTA